MESVSFGTSLLVALVGILVVLLGLCVLIGLIKLLAMATSNIGKPKAKQEAAPAPAPAPWEFVTVMGCPAVPPASAPVQEEAAPAQDDALIAVITAAVACMMEDGSAFTVRRVRRVSSAPAWQRAGREEQIYSHF